MYNSSYYRNRYYIIYSDIENTKKTVKLNIDNIYSKYKKEIETLEVESAHKQKSAYDEIYYQDEYAPRHFEIEDRCRQKIISEYIALYRNLETSLKNIAIEVSSEDIIKNEHKGISLIEKYKLLIIEKSHINLNCYKSLWTAIEQFRLKRNRFVHDSPPPIESNEKLKDGILEINDIIFSYLDAILRLLNESTKSTIKI